MEKKIYLARQEGTNLYKIGISKNPIARMLSLQTGNANPIILIETFSTMNGFKMENALHQEFKSNRKEGEWFELEQKHIDSFFDICNQKEELLNYMKKNNYFWQ